MNCDPPIIAILRLNIIAFIIVQLLILASLIGGLSFVAARRPPRTVVQITVLASFMLWIAIGAVLAKVY